MNVFEEIYDQTKFLSDKQLSKLFDVLVNDSKIIEMIEKDPSLIISLNSMLYEIATRNYDRPYLFWNLLASTFIFISTYETKNKPALDGAQKEKLSQTFTIQQNKLEAIFESLSQKKSRKLAVIQLFVHYSLLELCLKFCHQSKDLPGFEDVFEYTLQCLTKYSAPILIEFIKMMQEAVNSYQFTESEYTFINLTCL